MFMELMIIVMHSISLRNLSSLLNNLHLTDTKTVGGKKSNGVDSSSGSRPAAKRPRLADDTLPDDDDADDELQQPLSSPIVVSEPLRGPAPAPVLHAPISDSHMRLKYSYGINAWKQWVTAKNVEIETSAAASGGVARSGGRAGPMKLFKSEILQCGAEELSVALSIFVRELRKPTGEKYSPDSIYYLCLGKWKLHAFGLLCNADVDLRSTSLTSITLLVSVFVFHCLYELLVL
jgi:hypothetical protein